MRISDWSSDVCSSDLVRQIAHGPVVLQQPVPRRLVVTGQEGDGAEAAMLELVALDKLDEVRAGAEIGANDRSEEHTSELQSLMRISYAVFCLKKKKITNNNIHNIYYDHEITHHHTTIITLMIE